MNNLEKDKMIADLLDNLEIDSEKVDLDNLASSAIFFLARKALKEEFDMDLSTTDLDMCSQISMDVMVENIELRVLKYLNFRLYEGRLGEKYVEILNKKVVGGV